MPQSFCVVQCHECRTFCVQQDKKVPKFRCAVCGTQQAMQRIYARSSKAKDCREVASKYNAARGEADFDADLADANAEEAQLRSEEEDEGFGGGPAGPGRWGDYAAGDEPEVSGVWCRPAHSRPAPHSPGFCGAGGGRLDSGGPRGGAQEAQGGGQG